MFSADAGSDTNWRILFNERELKEIDFCKIYAGVEFSHGTDGHLIRVIVARMATQLDVQAKVIQDLQAASQNQKASG